MGETTAESDTCSDSNAFETGSLPLILTERIDWDSARSSDKNDLCSLIYLFLKVKYNASSDVVFSFPGVVNGSRS